MASKPWKCRKKSCQAVNPPGKRKCWKCGKLKPPKRIPAHRKVLKELTYEDFIELNGGEFCWIHRAQGLPDPYRTKRLQRDHDHNTGQARGLLCYQCNRWLAPWITPEFLEAAAAYLRRDLRRGDSSATLS